MKNEIQKSISFLMKELKRLIKKKEKEELTQEEKETLDKKSLEADEKELYNKFMVLQSDYPKCVIIRGHPY